MLGGEVIKLWAAEALPGDGLGEPGQVLSVDVDGITVQTGAGALRLTELQRPGGKRLSAAEFLRGQRIEVGQVFAAVAPQKAR